MAEGGSFERTVDGSEICYDFNCSVCISKKSAYSEAACYCPQCHEYFCKRCLFDYGCDHDHLGRGSVAKWGQSSRRYHFDECRQHKTNTIQLYCPRDDVVCCAVCGQTDHKSCGDLKYIPIIAKGKVNTSTKQASLKDLADVDGTVDRMCNNRRARLVEVKKTSKKMEKTIMDEQARAIARLNQLTQQSLDEVKTFETSLTDRFTSEIELFEDMKSDILDMRQKLDNDKVDEYLMFSRVKMSKVLVDEEKQHLNDMSNETIHDKTRFTAHVEISETLDSYQNLGSIVDEISDNNGQSNHGTTEATAKDDSDCIPFHNVKLNEPYEVIKSYSFCIDSDKNEEKCNIRGMCQLANGNIVVADFGNNQLTLLDTEYNVVCHMSTTGSPNNVCNTVVGEVAVALVSPNVIQFVSVGDEMIATSSFSISHKCNSICYNRSRLYAIKYHGKTVFVYNASGVLLHSISKNQHDQDMFSDTRSIAVNPSSEILHIGDGDNGVVTMDLKGNHLVTFKPPELALGVQCICIDRAGQIILTCCDGEDAFQIASNGKQKLAQLLPHAGCHINAGKVCFDNVKISILVAAHEKDTITVFYLSQDSHAP